MFRDLAILICFHVFIFLSIHLFPYLSKCTWCRKCINKFLQIFYCKKSEGAKCSSFFLLQKLSCITNNIIILYKQSEIFTKCALLGTLIAIPDNFLSIEKCQQITLWLPDSRQKLLTYFVCLFVRSIFMSVSLSCVILISLVWVSIFNQAFVLTVRLKYLTDFIAAIEYNYQYLRYINVHILDEL